MYTVYTHLYLYVVFISSGDIGYISINTLYLSILYTYMYVRVLACVCVCVCANWIITSRCCFLRSGSEGHDDSDRCRQQRHGVSGRVGGGRHEQRPAAGPAGSEGAV